MTTTRRRDFYLAEPERWWRYSDDLKTFEEVKRAERVRLRGWGELDAFAHKCPNGLWEIVDGVTGTSFNVMPSRSKQQALSEALINMEKELGNSVHVFLMDNERLVREIGLSPRYAYYPEDDE